MGADGEGFGEQRDDLVGHGRGGDVVVLGCEAEQQVADAAAGEVCLMAGLAQVRAMARAARIVVPTYALCVPLPLQEMPKY